MLIAMPNELIKGLIAHEKAAYYKFYKEFKPTAIQVIRQHAHINAINSDDLLQEAFLILYRKAHEGELDRDDQLKPYFAQVCHYLCKNYTRRKSHKLEVTTSFNEIPPFGESGSSIDYASHERSLLYSHHFSKLGAICRQLLTLFFQKTPMTTIAQRLQLSNAEAARARKYRCIKLLTENIRQDPRFKELTNDSDHAS